MTGRCAAFVLLTSVILAGTLVADSLPGPLTAIRPELNLAGQATLRWFGLHVYDIALYAQKTPYTPEGTAALSIRYRISIKHSRLLKTTLKEWRRLKIAEEGKRLEWIDALDSMWPDVKPGDSITAFRRLAGPTAFYFGDKLLGSVDDPAFGPAFFAIWLDEDCRYPEVRKGLLDMDE